MPLDPETRRPYRRPNVALAPDESPPDRPTTVEPPSAPVSGTASVPGTTQSMTPADAPVPHAHMDEHG